MATFNIYGCCICRDLFSFVPYNRHEVIHFLQSSSQITNFVLNTKPKNQMTVETFENINRPNFQKKCIINDYNKTLVDYYIDKADFFIVDLINIANTNLVKQIYDDGTVHYFTDSSWFSIAYKCGLKDFFNDSVIEKINRLQYVKENGYDDILDNLIKWIKSLGYKEEQIILIENNRTPYYTHNQKLYCFPEATRDEVNALVDDLCKSFKEKCSGCHTIKMPIVTYADSNHKWSLTDLHYCHEFYEYLYKCVDAIAEDLLTCDEKIAQIREEYSILLYKKLNKFIRNSLVGKQYLNDDLSAPKGFYIADEGTEYYEDAKCTKGLGTLSKCSVVSSFGFPSCRIAEGYVKSDDCIKGLIGKELNINQSWQLINAGTCVLFNDHSIVIKHCGNKSKAQMNIVQTVNNVEELYNTTVTLSVWTRVLRTSNNKGKGGTIAFINSNTYNSGKFFKSKGFANTDWKRISLTVKLPKKEDFKGLTICLRANAGVGDEPQHAIVEFANPKLEIGSTPTDC